MLYKISLYETLLKTIAMGKKEKEIKKDVKVVKDDVPTITRPGGGKTTDNRSTSRRFKNVKL